MAEQSYKQQVSLLLSVLPEVAKESCFALHGGTAINLFVREMPRLSVDIDLTYLPLEDRLSTLIKINTALDEIKTGSLLCLLSSDRPISEVLNPNLIDQRQTLANHFDGMATEPFTYDDFEATRAQLIGSIRASLTAADKQFLLSFKNLKPDWGIHNFEMFPAIQWKLQNLQKLKDRNSAKHLELLQRLERLIASYES